MKRRDWLLDDDDPPDPTANATNREINPPSVTASRATSIEMKRRANRERMMAGLEHARLHGTKSGKPIGRPRAVVTIEKIIELKKKGLGWIRIGRELGVSSSTVRRRYLTYALGRAGVSKSRKTGFETGRGTTGGSLDADRRRRRE